MKLTFADDPKVLTRVDHLLVIAPKALFGPRSRGSAALRRLLGEALAALANQLGSEASPGLLAGSATSRTAAGGRLTVAALADRISRHACPARSESVRKAVAAAGFEPGAHNGVLLLLERPEHALPGINAIGRALPTFTRKSKAPKPGTLSVVCATTDGAIRHTNAVEQDLVTRAREAAALVDTPPTELDPAAFAAAARRMLRAVPGVRVQEIVGPALLPKKLYGVHAVGRAAKSPPRVVIATTAGKRGPRVALVGKGVTYDTGGLHLKARGAMETMKSDMGGAAAVLGAFLTLARHAKDRRVTLVLCLAENAIGPLAYKPDDVLTMHSGKTVEINNTDAEGRLLLADGCSYAARVLGCEVVIDAATLTGAQGVATGDLHAAVVSNDDGVEQALLDAGRATGDLCWPLPFAPEYYRSEFRSPIADMRNSVKNRSNAQSACAAEFVHWHLDGTDARWGHVDLAFPAFRGERGTGFGVALLAEAVQRLA